MYASSSILSVDSRSDSTEAAESGPSPWKESRPCRRLSRSHSPLTCATNSSGLMHMTRLTISVTMPMPRSWPPDSPKSSSSFVSASAIRCGSREDRTCTWKLVNGTGLPLVTSPPSFMSALSLPSFMSGHRPSSFEQPPSPRAVFRVQASPAPPAPAAPAPAPRTTCRHSSCACENVRHSRRSSSHMPYHGAPAHLCGAELKGLPKCRYSCVKSF
mmetsp:Transcript_68978/g.191013  ORF Transcript_68978/g.191013 Transcript_68978/m.191013 type:complete len:215 (-) Transcript_68978:64-708(-)